MGGPLRVGRPVLCGVSRDSLFCRHISSLSPPLGKGLLAEEVLRLLDVVCATETFNQWGCCITGFAVAFSCPPQSRCPCGLSLTYGNIRQLFQTQDQRASVMNGAGDAQALSCQVTGCHIILLACRCLG